MRKVLFFVIAAIMLTGNSTFGDVGDVVSDENKSMVPLIDRIPNGAVTEVPTGLEPNGIVLSSASFFFMPVPTGQETFVYPTTASPVTSITPASAKPIGVGSVATGGPTLRLNVSFASFSGPVDIYVGLYSPAIDPYNIYLITDSLALQPLALGFTPWKSGVASVNEVLYGDIQTYVLPDGDYVLYAFVTPSGSFNASYLWVTGFSVHNYNPPATCTYTYSDWSACVNGLQGRTVISSTPAGCTGAPVLEQSCAVSTYSGITLSITDQCNDGYLINYRFFDVDNNLVWPSSTATYVTSYYTVKYSSNLRCLSGAKICFGGRTGSRYWGVDVDESKSCKGCCVTCTDGLVYGWNLTCN